MTQNPPWWQPYLTRGHSKILPHAKRQTHRCCAKNALSSFHGWDMIKIQNNVLHHTAKNIPGVTWGIGQGVQDTDQANHIMVPSSSGEDPRDLLSVTCMPQRVRTIPTEQRGCLWFIGINEEADTPTSLYASTELKTKQKRPSSVQSKL